MTRATRVCCGSSRVSYARGGIVLSVLLVATILNGCGKKHPDDEAMEQNFRAHRGDFVTLAKMFSEDEDVARLDQKFVFLAEGSDRSLSQERLEQYRRLLGKLGLEGGMHRDKEGAIRLIASTSRALLSESEKSYVYSRSNPSPLLDSLDRVVAGERGDQHPVYKEIEDDWYLYYESW